MGVAAPPLFGGHAHQADQPGGQHRARHRQVTLVGEERCDNLPRLRPDTGVPRIVTMLTFAHPLRERRPVETKSAAHHVGDLFQFLVVNLSVGHGIPFVCLLELEH